MAEVLGGIASVVQIAQAIAVLIKATRQLCTRLKNAPEQLLDLEAELLCTERQLVFVQAACDDAHDHIIPKHVRASLEMLIARASANIASMDAMSYECLIRGNLNFRLHWATKDKQRLDKALRELQRSRDSIHVVLQGIIFRSQVVAVNQLDRIEHLVESVKDACRQQSPDLVVQKQPQSGHRSAKRSLYGKSRSSGTYWARLGVQYTMVPTSQGAHADYHFAIKASIPLVRMLQSYVLMMTVSVRTFPLCTLKVHVESSLAVARTMPRSSPFFFSCETGDVQAVRNMLLTGEGRLSDIDEDNWTALAHAIVGGHCAVVKELMDAEVDIDATFGHNQTSPLQWALWQKQYEVAKMLLNKGASQDHVNLFGWNATFFCWPRQSRTSECMVRYLRLLEDDAYLDLDVVDGKGWSVLHRVAAHGLPSDVHELIKLGADPEQVALPLRWNAIHHATFYDNLEAFEILVPYYKSVTAMVDERGWTLLHIAASAGNFEIARRLLELGANPDVQSFDCTDYEAWIPESLHGRCCTPAEAAEAQCAARAKQFVGIVDDFLAQEMDVFYDAEEAV